MELKTCNILGLDILVTDMEKTVNLIEQNIEQLRGKYICVGNVHTTVMAHDDPQYHTVQADSEDILDNIQKDLEECGFLAKLLDFEPVDFWEKSE